MSIARVDSHVARTVHRLITGGQGGSIKHGRTFDGQVYALITAGARVHGAAPERYVITAPTFGQLFTALAGCFGPDDQPLAE